MAANPQEAHQVGRHRDRPIYESDGRARACAPVMGWRTPAPPEGGAGAAVQAGGFQMMTFLEGSSPGALAILP
jgi:hypothetical protein